MENCEKCGGELESILIYDGDGIDAFKCKDCGKIFKELKYMKKHIMLC